MSPTRPPRRRRSGASRRSSAGRRCGSTGPSPAAASVARNVRGERVEQRCLSRPRAARNEDVALTVNGVWVPAVGCSRTEALPSMSKSRRSWICGRTQIVRGESQPAERPALRIPRGRVLLTLLLPTGSQLGPYEIEVRDRGAVVKVSARGDAELRNQVSVLHVAVATGSLSAGRYQLAIRHVGDGWQEIPLRIE